MNIPAAELKTPGVLCKTTLGTEYQITRNEAKDSFTLWKLDMRSIEKVSTNKDIEKLYGMIPWKD